MTETPILDDRTVSEIEDRANAATKGPWEPRDVSPFGDEILIDTVHDGLRGAIAKVINPARFMSSVKQQEEKDSQTRANALFIQNAREDIPALCATVRHLRAKHEQLALASGEWASLLDRIRAWSKCSDGYPLDEHINNITVERERLATGLVNLYHVITGEQSLQSQLEQLRVELAEEKRLRAELKQIAQIGISEVSSVGTVLKDNALIDFRSRAIQLCKDKAAEYLAEFEEDEDNFTAPACAGVAEVLAAEIEKL